MLEKNDLKKEDLEFLKSLFLKPQGEAIPSKIEPLIPDRTEVVFARKPEITSLMKEYQEETGKMPYDMFGKKTQEYKDWVKYIRAIHEKRKKKVITTIVEEEAIETLDLSPLIQKNIEALKNITQYLKSMDNSLQTLTKGPIKVEIVK
ncbi:MAG: hypothetical protein ACTSQJ_11760 [Promethearchaeota archaeon]